jgi:hypothetical protein
MEEFSAQKIIDVKSNIIEILGRNEEGPGTADEKSKFAFEVA